MNPQPRKPEEIYGPALEKARRALPGLDPGQAAGRAAVTFHQDAQGGLFHIPFFGTIYQVGWPEGSVRRADDQSAADISTQLILLHYLLTADGTPMADHWIAFRSLPGGLGYDAAFQARASIRLARAFGADRNAFEAAARTLGGEPLTFGDSSFLFRALPRVWLAVVLHLADDEFPAQANLLFDASAGHYLPTEDLAVLGGILAGLLVRAARDKQT